MKPIILIDCDDVIIDLVSTWIDEFNKKYNTKYSIYDIREWDIAKCITTHSKEQIFSILYDKDFIDKIKPIKNSFKYMYKLKKLGYDIKILTSTDYRLIGNKINKLLALFPYLSSTDFIITTYKELVHGDIIIDDNINNLCDNICKRKLKILFDRPHNQSINISNLDNIVRVSTWKDIYKLIKSTIKI